MLVWLLVAAIGAAALVPVTVHPRSGARGTVVSIRGLLGASASARGCLWGVVGDWSPALLDDASEIRCVVPAAADDGVVSVCVAAHSAAHCLSAAAPFVVGLPPRATYVSTRTPARAGRWVTVGGSDMLARMVCVVCGLASAAVAVTPNEALCRLPEECAPGLTTLTLGLDATQQQPAPLALTVLAPEADPGAPFLAPVAAWVEPHRHRALDRDRTRDVVPPLVPAPSRTVWVARVVLVAVLLYWMKRLVVDARAAATVRR